MNAVFNRFPFWVDVCLKPGQKPPQKDDPNAKKHDDLFDWLSYNVRTGKEKFDAKMPVSITKEELVVQAADLMISHAESYMAEMELETAMYDEEIPDAIPIVADPQQPNGLAEFIKQRVGKVTKAVARTFVTASSAVFEGPHEQVASGTQRVTQWLDHVEHCITCYNDFVDPATEHLLAPNYMAESFRNDPERYQTHLKHVMSLGKLKHWTPYGSREYNLVYTKKDYKKYAVWVTETEPVEAPVPPPEFWLQAFPLTNALKSSYSKLRLGCHGVVAYMSGWTTQQYVDNIVNGTRCFGTWIADKRFVAVLAIIVLVLALSQALKVTKADILTPEEVMRKVAESYSTGMESVQTTREVFNTALHGKRLFVVSGSGISSIGKGTFVARLIHDLTKTGRTVGAIKIDPYYNWGAGKFNPSEHGETYVTEDGTECDLDLGRYVRAGANVSGNSSWTGGKLQHWSNAYSNPERSQTVATRAEFLREEALAAIMQNMDTVIEVGGTVTDPEAKPFQMALHQVMQQVETFNFVVAPVVKTTGGELKRRLVVEGIRQTREAYGQPVTAALYRSDEPLRDIDLEGTPVYPLLDSDIQNPSNPQAFYDFLDLRIDATEYVPITDVTKVLIVSKYPDMDAHVSIRESLVAELKKTNRRPAFLIAKDIKDFPADPPDMAVIAGGFGTTGILPLIPVIEIS
jgi:hypothetical protein